MTVLTADKDKRSARDEWVPVCNLLSLHNPVARAARATGLCRLNKFATFCRTMAVLDERWCDARLEFIFELSHVAAWLLRCRRRAAQRAILVLMDNICTPRAPSRDFKSIRFE